MHSHCLSPWPWSDFEFFHQKTSWDFPRDTRKDIVTIFHSVFEMFWQWSGKQKPYTFTTWRYHHHQPLIINCWRNAFLIFFHLSAASSGKCSNLISPPGALPALTSTIPGFTVTLVVYLLSVCTWCDQPKSTSCSLYLQPVTLSMMFVSCLSMLHSAILPPFFFVHFSVLSLNLLWYTKFLSHTLRLAG